MEHLRKTHNVLIGVIALAFFLTGCSASGSRFQDSRFATERVARDKTRIVFYRQTDVNFRSATVAIDGSIVGALAHRGFIVADTEPGDHKFSAWVRYTPLGEFAMYMNLTAGETYYLRVSHRTERLLYALAGPVGAVLVFADRKGEFQLEPVPAAIALTQLKELKLSE
jgi:Protein of unknown function (DUF2846)